MSHRLQVILDDEEYAALQAAARRSRSTVSAYVREALRSAREGEPTAPIAQKLMVVRDAAEYGYPVADPETIESEIASGYLDRG